MQHVEQRQAPPDDRMPQPISGRCRRWGDVLQRHGYRLTAPRLAVLRVLDEAGMTALDVLQIRARARNNYASLGKATIYRTLERMEALGLVRRVHDEHGCHRFVAAEYESQPLLVCTACRRVQSAPPIVLAGLANLLADACGYQVDADALQIAAICPGCR